MLYYAYGSNMNWLQMRQRCPSARFVGIAKLPEYRLAFTRKSKRRNCGVADIVSEKDINVWGVIYVISDIDIGALDKAEGYCPGTEHNSYWRHECMVYLDGDEAKPITASAYFAEPEPNTPLPNQAYKDLILSGARNWHLPEDYIRELEKIEVQG
jgi:gamma-glutamylcyclotransferase